LRPDASTRPSNAPWTTKRTAAYSRFSARCSISPPPIFGGNTTACSQEVRTRADKQFSLLKANAQHPSLQFKKVGERHGQEIWSARVTLNHRALAIKRADGYLWFWIGDHKAYEALIS
jgi:hypothetical protein